MASVRAGRCHFDSKGNLVAFFPARLFGRVLLKRRAVVIQNLVVGVKEGLVEELCNELPFCEHEKRVRWRHLYGWK